MAATSIRVVRYHDPLVSLLDLIHCSTFSYAEDQSRLSSIHLALKPTRIEPAHPWHCCPGSKGLPCLDHVSATQCSSSHRQSSNQGSSHIETAGSSRARRPVSGSNSRTRSKQPVGSGEADRRSKLEG
uniref:Uncharacterized protein n=1 Tax=Arundo donax TaxID=35708 RepID=A0A0A9A625_ARUDO